MLAPISRRFASTLGLIGILLVALVGCGDQISSATAEQMKPPPEPVAKKREQVTVAQALDLELEGGPFKKGTKKAKYDPIERAVVLPTCQQLAIFLQKSTVCPKLIWTKGDAPILALDLHFFGKDWLFMEGVKIAAGDHVITRKFNWDPAFSEQDSSGRRVVLHEWRGVILSDNAVDVKAILTATEVQVRLVGRASYVDLENFLGTAQTLAATARIYERYRDAELVD